ncbi:MAG: SHOCT domain-containing protein [Candidatus Jettenia sp.]|uniref:SHOCT domain-containing protein n=1 Tax=Candidatus Jettenia caeni TaxID=247490 RepID=I3IH02_9BACT|nr:SHOCT domain-containing protein [Candidatus Jettenia sp. AMX1]MBC6929051.1 SHOCT domain-containing protein [Candidatus Jettenia sp.]NUN23550.1 SHOCT domain-containing protein [Candidatus Jettenia caeni]KAA0249328.1 MAG: SHOCT domain-containing protein [Candidatus Jettenia sp. AMX1]MCE7881483.1 SHOCT domain-containing protein [Candidatus Jettenia sp. AMX1]MCQ3928030.1 SHOCT domain-containing protein [Candidatus Jettenia sp.]
MFWFHGPFSWLLFFLVIGMVAYLVIRYTPILTKRGAKKSLAGSVGESPLEILEKRFARGEITEEEFDKIKKKLE